MTSQDPNERPHDELDNSFKDHLVAVGKAAVSAVPGVGGLIGEAVSSFIPNLRAERVTTYLRELSLRVDGLDEELKAEISRNAEKIDLIEEGGYQAARATTSKRIEMIVEAVSRGLTLDEADLVRRKRLLSLLGELDEDEVVLLNAYGRAYGSTDRHPFSEVSRPPPAALGSGNEAIEREKLYEAGPIHLERLGLLTKKFGNLKKGEMPEFDKSSGDFKHRKEISFLGRMLLKEVGMPTEFDARNIDN